MGLVYNIAKRFVGRGYEIEDLNQIGAMGLVKSIKKFDTNYNVQLSTYAVPFIIGEIKRYIEDDSICFLSPKKIRFYKKEENKLKLSSDHVNVPLPWKQVCALLLVSFPKATRSLRTPFHAYSVD